MLQGAFSELKQAGRGQLACVGSMSSGVRPMEQLRGVNVCQWYCRAVIRAPVA